MATEMELIVQALGIAIVKKQRHLYNLNRKLPLADSNHKQGMILKSIRNTTNKVKEFTNLKLKLEL
jgi:hypothetical protein